MREELNIGQGRFASATSGASMDIGGVNANFRVPRRTDASTSNPRKMALPSRAMRRRCTCKTGTVAEAVTPFP